MTIAMTETQGAMTQGHWLHYVGAKYYTPKTFKKEAKKYGVARATPIPIAKTMKFGERVLLAFKKDPEEECTEQKAWIFGYFTISGVNIKGLTEEANKELMGKLRVIEYHESKGDGGGGGTVDRRCGSYSIGSTAIIDNTLRETVEAIEEVAKKYNLDVQIFLTGSFHEIEEPYEIFAPFTRGYMRLTEDGVEELEDGGKVIKEIQNYQKRKHLPERAKCTESLIPFLAEE
ncbi:MAG: hypothetical protein DRO00_01180 [Thermoproteota archaeon]|nr:MAG: hypothetical protein DRO00_01180 [Candidatus Korarchaeota archaeon]